MFKKPKDLRVFFIGSPGGGKSTQASRLAASINVPHVEASEIVRENFPNRAPRNGEVAKAIFERITRPDCKQGFVVSGFPRTLAQALDFEVFAARARIKIDRVFAIIVDKKTAVARMKARKRPGENKLVRRNKLKGFQESFEQIAEFYRRRGVLAELSTKAIQKNVGRRIEKGIRGILKAKKPVARRW